MATVPADVRGPSDAELIDSVRGGAIDAYGQLYERHVGAAYNLARQLARSSAEADDLVSDAFAKVLDTLRAGRGPDAAFRAYLLTALRHTAYDKTRRDKKVDLSDDITAVPGAAEATSVPFRDTAVAGLERSLAAKAFARLPERWQTVLWHTEIEGQSPAEVAPLLGLTANGVSALAYRAREGLRQAYLQVHLAEATPERCRATADRLGAWTRGGLSKRETTQVEAHLDECADCRALAAELADVNGALRAFIAPLVLGVGASGYLAATVSTAKVATAVAVGAGAGAGGAAGAATSAPRQLFIGAASAAALVIAVALGLASDGDPRVPAAQTVPPATSATQTTQPSVPALPPPPTQDPPTTTQDPSTTTPAPTTEPEPVPPQPQPEPAPEPEPEPEPEPTPDPPVLVPTVPSGFTLTPGSPPVSLPITVRNTGGTTSSPANASLTLPPGVRSVGPGASLAGARLVRIDGAGDQTVDCPAGEGAITCVTTQGLAPGGAATFVFRLRAGQDAVGGQITGTVSAGTTISVDIRVDVAIQPVDDDLDLQVRNRHHGFWDPRLDIKATNTGGRAGTLELVVESDRHIAIVALRPDCSRTSHRIVCRQPLERGEAFRLSVWAFGLPFRGGNVTVTATLGTASRSIDVPIRPHPDDGQLPEPPGGWPEPPEVPTTTTPPVTTTTAPTTTTTPEPTSPETTEPSAPPDEPSVPSETPTTPPPTTTVPPPTTTPPPARTEPPCRPLPWWPPGRPDHLPPGLCWTP
ncbi:RNA polymerase sigma factor (sigma-70 family) [Saccharothrix tamanrassetensis]|uniref:RNA polymerase sigma factor (Sigma-70 family) n=1 Tax=Saccharothrix tamanrassetensis TaxID=1051531 RepID=A0A841CDP8_9PSEU|nr:sigma-70 family RNA polymerase sigma factor [Saccharothrix tamanrassetensis]MBB5955120.1 RNA polymerase sigma factor (sigma-70 family) [Saccharothrix tamanrassetensis]